MKITLVEGAFQSACEFCKSGELENMVFELAPMSNDSEAFSEFNRFIEQFSDIQAFEQGSTVNTVIDLSRWNSKFSYNTYLEAFLYFLKDREHLCTVSFIFNKKADSVLIDKIKELELFELFTVTLDTVKESSRQVRIGFADTQEKGV